MPKNIPRTAVSSVLGHVSNSWWESTISTLCAPPDFQTKQIRHWSLVRMLC